MRSVISFKRNNRKMYLNTECIEAVLEHTDSADKTYIIVTEEDYYMVDLPVDVVIGKIAEAVNTSLQTGSFVCVDLTN